MNIKWFASLAFFILLEISETESQDVRVKLCGREFIRMVVTSCGSSRVRRGALDLQFANHHSVLQNWLSRDLSAHQKGPVEDEQWRQLDAPESMTERPAELQERSTTAQDFSTSSRSRRDVGPAGICCTSGCTMSELIQYC